MMNNELYHYGVLGMRWGVRKQEKAAASGKTLSKFAAKRYHTNEYNKALKLKTKEDAREAAGKYRKQSKEITERRFSSAKGIDDNVRERVTKSNLGKLIAEQAILGGRGSQIYNTKRAEGNSRLASLKASSKAAVSAHASRLVTAGLAVYGTYKLAKAVQGSASAADFISKAFTI